MSSNDKEKPAVNVERRDFLKSAIGFGICSASSTLFVLPLNGLCQASPSTGPMASLPSHTKLADGLGFYTLIRKSKASSPLYVTLDIMPSKAMNERLGSASTKELTSDEIRSIINELGAMKVLRLTFLGDDAFASPNMLDYIRLADKHNMSCGATGSGAHLGDDLLDKLSKIPFFDLNVSLNGANAQTHDRLHGTGHFDASVEAIKRARKRNIHVTVVTQASRTNFNEVEAIIDLARHLGANTYHLRRYIPLSDKNKAKIGELPLTREQAKSLLSLQDKRMKEGINETQIVGVDPFGGNRKLFVEAGVMSQRDNVYAWNVMCQSGATYMHITSTGLVTPCTWAPIAAGNFRKQRLAEIWNKSPAFNKLRGRESFDECIAHAFIETGDMLAVDPLKWA